MLLDSNQIIYSNKPEYAGLRKYIALHKPACSAISIAEVLGFHRLSQQDRQAFELFFRQARIYSVSNAIVHRAAELRQRRKLGLGDAIIAATALLNGLTLVTSNTIDFHWIPGLKIINPLATP